MSICSQCKDSGKILTEITKKHITYLDCPSCSLKKLEDIVRSVIRKELRDYQGKTPFDMRYLSDA